MDVITTLSVQTGIDSSNTKDGSEELYDHTNDPGEFHNLADENSMQAVVKEHRQWLPEKSAPNAEFDPNIKTNNTKKNNKKAKS